jgi:hypothetical protein
MPFQFWSWFKWRTMTSPVGIKFCLRGTHKHDIAHWPIQACKVNDIPVIDTGHTFVECITRHSNVLALQETKFRDFHHHNTFQLHLDHALGKDKYFLTTNDPHIVLGYVQIRIWAIAAAASHYCSMTQLRALPTCTTPANWTSHSNVWWSQHGGGTYLRISTPCMLSGQPF